MNPLDIYDRLQREESKLSAMESFPHAWDFEAIEAQRAIVEELDRAFLDSV